VCGSQASTSGLEAIVSAIARTSQQVLIELVDRLARQRALAHGGIDLGGAQPELDRVSRDLRQLARGRRVVALVRDGDNLVRQPERE